MNVILILLFRCDKASHKNVEVTDGDATELNFALDCHTGQIVTEEPK